ncbi:MAG: bifunctional oligoribonuclease/PAP phosphatase NrnA [Clostridia bacterium]|nr:bifunctional oligoribonuclease/PAP phosphatase NrnA [Clostridia bacterium]
MNRITAEEAAKILLGQDDILVLTHRSPDGDTLGSAYAVCHALRRMGKRINVACADEIAEKYSYLAAGMQDMDFEPRFILAVDVADEKLLGNLRKIYGGSIDMCIDHHGSNTGYADKLLLKEVAACAEIIYELLLLMKAPIDVKIAECIYTGISTDTGCFRYSNTTAQSHYIAAKLMETGFNYFIINRLMFEIKSKEFLQLEQKAIAGMEYYLDGRVAVITLTKEMMDSVDPSSLEYIAPLPRQVEGVRCGFTLKQVEENHFRISVRTGHELDASKICAGFGGGGHKRAAGCSFTGTKDELIGRLIKAVEKEMQQPIG